METGKCASLYIKSEPRFGRCLPSDMRLYKKKFLDDENLPLKMDGSEIGAKEIKTTSKAFALTFNAQAMGELALQDLMNVQWFVMWGLIVGMVVSFLWILMMQVLAGLMVWLSMIALTVLSGFFSFYSLSQYKFYKDFNQTEISRLEDEDLDIVEIDFVDIMKVQFGSLISNATFWLIALVVSTIVFFLLSVTFIALRQRVQIAIALIREASK